MNITHSLTKTITCITVEFFLLIFCYSRWFGYDRNLNIWLDITAFNIISSTIDILVVCCLRNLALSLLFLMTILHPSKTKYILNRLRYILWAMFATFGTYSAVKLLLYDEKPGFVFCRVKWCILLSTNALFSLLDLLLVNSFANQTFQRNTLPTNDSSGERDPLISLPEPKSNESNEIYSRPSQIFRMLMMTKPDAHLVLIVFMGFTIGSIAEAILPLYTGDVLAAISIDKDFKKASNALLTMVLVSICGTVAVGIRGGVVKLLTARFSVRIRLSLYASILRQDIGFFDSTQTGEITSRLNNDTSIMQTAISPNANVFARVVIKTAIIIGFMASLSWQLTLVSVIGVPFVVVVSKVYGDFFDSMYKRRQSEMAKANNAADEVISSMRTVRSCCNERGEVRTYRRLLAPVYRLDKRICFIYAGYLYCEKLFSLALLVLTLAYAAHLVATERMAPSDLIAFMIYQFQLAECIEILGSTFTSLMQASGASHKVFEYIDRKPDIDSDEGKIVPSKLNGAIEFRNVNFTYPSRPNCEVLKDVSFSVTPGEVVALVGPSGGGKSTCIGLLQHFYEPTSGEVLLDGINVKEYKHSFLHHSVSLVSQEPVLYARSIFENILYGCDLKIAAKLYSWLSKSLPCASSNQITINQTNSQRYGSIDRTIDNGLLTLRFSDEVDEIADIRFIHPIACEDMFVDEDFEPPNKEEVKQIVEDAAKQANAHQFISEIEDGYFTQTGEKGAKLSGGQKQRIAIARALVRNPIVLLLDEATSALDANAEFLVQEAIYGARGAGRSVIVIAHRLSTVERADRIVVIDHGTVKEQGSHKELLNLPDGLYAQLVKRQLFSFFDN